MATVKIVVDHFDTWSEEYKNDKVLLLESKDLQDGRVLVKLQIDLYEIKLFVPEHYPQYDEGSNFYIEGPATVGLWCNSLNEFLLDNSDKKFQIKDVLNRIVQTYIAKSECNDYNQSLSSDDDDHTEDEMAEEMDEDDSDDNGMFIDDMLSDDDRIFTTDWELRTTRLKIQWKAREAKLREEMAKNASAESDSTKYKQERVKQIFSNPAASAVLTNDLINVMEHEKVTGISSQPIDDNIFKWIVKLAKFEENSLLAQDLKQLNEKFNYDYIELRMEFDMDLYPFYPPTVRVIRPRIKGINNENPTSFDFLKLFQLSYWNPTSNMKDILEKVKQFLQTYCRLNLTNFNCKNDPIKYVNGAYYDVENSLLSLSVVSEITPRGARNSPPSYPLIQAFLPQTQIKPTTAGNSSKSLISIDSTQASSSSSSNSSLETSEGEKLISFSAPSSPLAFKTSKGASNLKTYVSSADVKKSKQIRSVSIHKLPIKFTASGVVYPSKRVGWDVKAYMAAQKEKDRQLEIVLSDVLQDLRKEFSAISKPELESSSSGEGSSFSSEVANGNGNGNYSDGSISSSSNGSSCPVTNSAMDDVIYGILEGSALIPFLEKYLKIDSFLEISHHVGLYRVIISIVSEIAKQPSLVGLLTLLPGQSTSLYSLLEKLSEKANYIISQIDKISANGSIPGMLPHSNEISHADDVVYYNPMLLNKSSKTGINSDKTSNKNSNLADDKIARSISQLFLDVAESLTVANLLPIKDDVGTIRNGLRNNNPSKEDNERMDCEYSVTVPLCQPSTSVYSQTEDEALAEIYRKCLKPLQFESCSLTVDNETKGHHFAGKVKNSSLVSKQQILRIAQELSSLSSSLPLDLASSIFVRTDEANCTLMRALITGPEGTPYSNGCFVFDIYFPNNYPKIPPIVHFQTTGGGTVRFNPNLYNCGKVCLSLLGTWNGAQGEMWTEMSTVLQVLVSIQSLILVQDPYFNEPGFESFIGTDLGKVQSDNYNIGVKTNNITYGMIDQLRNPTPGFEEVIKAHFYVKRKKIIEEIDKWVLETPSKLKADVKTLKTMLLKLEPPNEDVAKLTSKI